MEKGRAAICLQLGKPLKGGDSALSWVMSASPSGAASEKALSARDWKEKGNFSWLRGLGFLGFGDESVFSPHCERQRCRGLRPAAAGGSVHPCPLHPPASSVTSEVCKKAPPPTPAKQWAMEGKPGSTVAVSVPGRADTRTQCGGFHDLVTTPVLLIPSGDTPSRWPWCAQAHAQAHTQTHTKHTCTYSPTHMIQACTHMYTHIPRHTQDIHTHCHTLSQTYFNRPEHSCSHVHTHTHS